MKTRNLHLTAFFFFLFLYSSFANIVFNGVPANELVECYEIPDPPIVTATTNCGDPTVIITFDESSSNQSF